MRAGVSTIVAGLALSAFPAAAPAQTPPSVTSSLPAWRAPGGALALRGTAAPGAAVELWLGASKRAETTAEPDGAYAFGVRMPAAPQRYAVGVVSGGLRTEAGSTLVRPVRLSAVGDVNLGNGVATAMARHGLRWPWLYVASKLRAADIALVNLECTVSTRGNPWPGKLFTFRGTPAALQTMRTFAGIDVASLANNHSLDYGRLAFADMLAHAKRVGLRTIGGGADLTLARRPAVLLRGGLRIAFLGYAQERLAAFDAGPGRPGVAPAVPSSIRADVRRAKQAADVVVVYFHWGVELDRTPNARERMLAQVSLDAGASVVLGAHPHVLQPRVRRGNRFIAWSLGNFVFDWTSPGTDRTGILRLGLARTGVTTSSFLPARINWVQPRPQ